jgi:putative flippase GtrA
LNTRRQFVSFAAIGAAAFLVDTTALYAVRALGGDLYGGRVVSFLTAATFTWALNRRYTFGATEDARIVQWSRFLGANALGGLVNYGVYSVLIAFVPVVRDHPVLGVAAGSLSGLVFNFFASRRWVFRRS